MSKMIKVSDEINLGNHLGAEYTAEKGPNRDPYIKKKGNKEENLARHLLSSRGLATLMNINKVKRSYRKNLLIKADTSMRGKALGRAFTKKV